LDITRLSDLLVIKGNSNNNGYIAIDEVYYSETIPASGVFGVYSNNPALSDKFVINNVNGFLYNWDGTVTFNNAYPAYEGEEALSFRSSGSSGWWGFGLFSSIPLNLTKFANGYLNLMLRTEATQTFTIAIQGANNTQAGVEFRNNNDPFGFIRDGRWHRISIPIKTLVDKGLDLSACRNIFTMSGSTIGNIAIDDIYFSENVGEIENVNKCRLATLTISPKNRTIREGLSQQYTAKATDQFDNPTDAYVTWFSDGGIMSDEGLFFANEAGVFNIWATLNGFSDSTTLTVQEPTFIDDNEANAIKIAYIQKEQTIKIYNLQPSYTVVISDLTGSIIYRNKEIENNIELSVSRYQSSILILAIITDQGIINRKIVKY
jgi:hypothetical protein